MTALSAPPVDAVPEPALRMDLGPAQEAARAEFAAFADAHVAPHAGAWDRAGITPPDAIRRLAESGWLGAVVPCEQGGAGMGWVTFGLLNEELGRACSSLRSLLTVHSMASYAVLRWGSRAQKERWLGPLARGEAIGAFALSEPNVGSDASAVETVATADGDGYVLRGTKKWTTYGQIADVFLLFAKLEGKPVAFLLERGTPGFQTVPLEIAGTRASMLAELRLDGCRVPREARLGGAGFGLAIAVATLEVGRYSVACGSAGIVRACLDASLAYAATRQQFGAAIGEHQLVQRMLANMTADQRAAHSLCMRAGWLRDQVDPAAAHETFIAKYFASTAATRAALDAVQIHGANGLTDAYPVERYLRDSRVMEIIEGSTQIQQVAIARGELEMHRRAR
ncbi:acyl-CoA dehydrogenase family protein [Longimicrobium sp.]|uniref:acyl-CoA dehydrogenase family protein n=1 Tax=Longimicrobium sp. TaxID=2029185 RepID=UPI002C19D14E|nr:acyl-CoA dehydrogenase family protein [Longimicrobium sp.]HSU14484.1 acyl-CoA dehydrogenase family protein [Longimicrobium sp.]